jgi:hypothetical protein
MKYCCRRKEKEENHGKRREETHEWVWGPFLKKKRMCNSLVLERTEKIIVLGT